MRKFLDHHPRPYNPRDRFLALALFIALFAASGVVNAFPDPLNLSPSLPDILVSDLAIDFMPYAANPPSGPQNDDPGMFTAVDTVSSTFSFFSADGTISAVNGQSYILDVVLDESSNLISGTLSILGGIADLGIADGSTLLAGDITAFGAEGSGPVGKFEFLLDVTASEAALGFGQQAGVILTSTDLAPGFTDAEPFMGTGTSDNLAQGVPEPTSLALLAIGGIGLCSVNRRRRRPGVDDATVASVCA